MSDSPIHRFLGGSPSSVTIRLIVISLIVGAAMVFFDLTPRDVIDSFRRLIDSILGSGLESLRTILVYIAYGAIIVVPIFLVVRLIRMGRG